MKIIIGDTTYTKIRNLHYCIDADITGTSMPANQFTVEAFGLAPQISNQTIELRDDLGQLWAKYNVDEIVRQEDGWASITALSPLRTLEQRTAPATMYSGETVGVELVRLLSAVSGVAPEFADPSLEALNISGFCPEQSYRDRVLHICMATGLHIRDYNTANLVVEHWPEALQTVPEEATSWAPEMKWRGEKLAVSCTAYTFTPGTPQQGDQSVEAGGITYIVTGTKVTLNKLPTPVPDSSTEDVSDCMLINAENADSVLARMAQYYFNGLAATAAFYNNHSYWPGGQLMVHTGPNSMVSGYATSMDFRFSGPEAMSQVEMVACTPVECAQLTVLYTWQGANLGKKVYTLPKNYQYNITTEFLDLSMAVHRYVYRPTVAQLTGTLTEDTTREVACELALDYNRKTRKLIVYSVDELNEESFVEDEETKNRVVIS